jgi:hypothetical protein
MHYHGPSPSDLDTPTDWPRTWHLPIASPLSIAGRPSPAEHPPSTERLPSILDRAGAWRLGSILPPRTIRALRTRLLFPYLLAGLLAGCASAGRLGEYDFRNRTVGVVTVAPPEPQVFTGDFFGPGGGTWLEALVRVGTEIARDVQAERAGRRMAEAVERVDVATLMAERVLIRSARLLRSHPVESIQEADFEMEVRVREYGLRAASWDARAHFFVEAEAFLLEGETGERIWRTKVEAEEPVTPGHWGGSGALGNVVTARALGSLSVEEIEGILRSLAEFSADKVAEKLEAGLRRARKQQ